MTLTLSEPNNGTHFVAGEAPVVAVTLADQFGRPFTREDLWQSRLAIAGPQETTKTVTAVKLLNSTADRSASHHHYIELATNADVQVDGNTLTYQLQPVTDEEPGTYIASFWAVLADSFSQQAMPVVEFQIGTATVEKQIVEAEKCAACHQGAATGQFYFHHVDPSGFAPEGFPSIDQGVVRTCKTCHNNEGYAAYRGDINAPTTNDPDARTPDPIVRRVHGVHNGSHLETTFNIDPTGGDFADYIHVEFPADVRNCTTCHVDDRWKTEPSQLACGACHDNTWFGEEADMPEGREAHEGGPQANDAECAVCHTSTQTGVAPIAVAHKIEPPAFKHTIDLAMSPPANGEYYVAGEAPTVTITIKDAATGEVISPSSIVEPADSSDVQADEWRRAYLFVSGPRANTGPVLTTAAEHLDPTHYYPNNDFRVRTNPADEDPRITRTATSIVYQLDDAAGLTPGTYTAWVETMPAAPLGGWALLNFQVGTATEEPKVATNCTQCHDDTRQHAGYFAVEFNPDICKSCHDYVRQIDGASGWTDRNNGYGAAPLSRRVHGVHYGRYLDKPEEVHERHDYSHVIFPQDVRNCTKCHSETDDWKEEPSRLACLACHDSDAAITHATLQTIDATPAEPYSGDEAESCKACHGANREFSPANVHNISDPYTPPYPREPED